MYTGVSKWMWTLTCVLILLHGSHSLHLTGTWDSSEDFYLFLAKFGFQKTDPGMLDDTQGFIYGNITPSSGTTLTSFYTLVLVDSEYFIEFYGNSSAITHDTCNRMFHKMDNLAFDPYCKPDGTEDFLRKIPCQVNKLCVDEDNPVNVLSGFQFTYKVQNSAYPRFWYLSLVACHRKSSTTDCNWYRNSSVSLRVDYDIWLVNGDPASKNLNPWEHQFSFEMHDVFEIYALFSVLYTIILPIWIYAYKKQIHPLTKLLTVCVSTEYAGVVFNFLHVLIFAFNGVGADWLKILGNLLGIFAECLFMLLLLLIAKGWTITSMALSSKKAVFGVWSVYTGLNALFFIIGLTKVNIIINQDEWNSWPGYLIAGFRLIVMIWFVLELRGTARHSRHKERLDFFQQFGAYYLVWFIYLPILVVIATQISHLWRSKTLLSIMYAADLLSYVVMIHLLWPSRSVLYMIKADAPLPQYELEATGLIDPDEMEETVFESPKKTRLQGSTLLAGHRLHQEDYGSKTNLLEYESDEIGQPMNGGLRNGHGVYTSISLDDEEEDDYMVVYSGK